MARDTEKNKFYRSVLETKKELRRRGMNGEVGTYIKTANYNGITGVRYEFDESGVRLKLVRYPDSPFQK